MNGESSSSLQVAQVCHEANRAFVEFDAAEAKKGAEDAGGKQSVSESSGDRGASPGEAPREESQPALHE